MRKYEKNNNNVVATKTKQNNEAQQISDSSPNPPAKDVPTQLIQQMNNSQDKQASTNKNNVENERTSPSKQTNEQTEKYERLTDAEVESILAEFNESQNKELKGNDRMEEVEEPKESDKKMEEVKEQEQHIEPKEQFNKMEEVKEPQQTETKENDKKMEEVNEPQHIETKEQFNKMEEVNEPQQKEPNGIEFSFFINSNDNTTVNQIDELVNNIHHQLNSGFYFQDQQEVLHYIKELTTYVK
ncbi:hypothetical protein QTN25_010058 [Entamoeba marina]